MKKIQLIAETPRGMIAAKPYEKTSEFDTLTKRNELERIIRQGGSIDFINECDGSDVLIPNELAKQSVFLIKEIEVE